MGNSFVYPSLKNAKHLDRLEEYRKYTISQILESFRFWISSEYSSGISLTKSAFDDVFGNLFDDCDLHFDSFIYKGVSSCSTYDVFYVLILLSDDLMSNKLQLLFQLGKEQDIVFRVDLIQSVFYKVIMSCQLLFDLPSVSRDEIHSFIETQLIQFVERNAANTLDAALLESIEIGGGLSSINGCNHALKTLTFLEVYQWCQDISQVNIFMESVESLVFDRRGKGNNRPNLSSPRKSNKRNSTLIAAVSAMKLSAQRARKASVVSKPKPEVNKVSSSVTSNLFTRTIHPLWTHTIQDIIANYGGSGYDTATATAVPAAMPSSSTPTTSPIARTSPTPPIPPPLRVESSPCCFYDDSPDLSSEDLLFVAFEQCVLSDHRALPVFTRDPIPPTEHHRTSLLMRGDSFNNKRPTMLVSSNSATGSNLMGAAPLLGSSTSSMNTSSNNLGTAAPVVNKDRYELFGIMDSSLVLSWMVQCCPTSVLQLVKQDEDVERMQQKQSQEFGLNKSILITNGNGEASAIHGILANIQQKESEDTHASEAERTFSLASVAIPNMNRLRARASLTGHQWQETGENIAHTTLRYIMAHNKFLLPTQKYSKQHTFTIDQYMYNAVYSMARGHNYVPVAGMTYHQVTHVLTANHVIRFILGHAAELLGKFRESVCVTSGLMRQPVVISNKLNFGSALYKMAKHHVDSVLVTDDKNRIQLVLTNKAVVDFWFVWCQQARKLDRSLTLGDIQAQYRNKAYKTYKESENVSFSIFSSLLTPLVHCQAILNIAIVSFDKFLAAGRLAPKVVPVGKGRPSGSKKVSMATIVEQSKNYSDTDSNSDDSEDNSDRDEDSSPEGDGRESRPLTATSAGRSSDDGSDGEEGEGRRTKKKKTTKKSPRLQKGSVAHNPPLGSKSPPTKKKTVLEATPHHAPTVPTLTAPVSTPSAVPAVATPTPTAPKGSMRSSISTARRTVATPSAPSPTAPRMTNMIERSKSPTNTAADRASIVASAARATQLVNQNRMSALNGPQNNPPGTDRKTVSLSINTTAVPPVGIAPLSVVIETTPTNSGRLTAVAPMLASPAEGHVRSPMRIISHRMTKQQIAAAKVLAAQKRELQEECDARVREARTLENWFRTMRLLTPTDSIQTALQIMLLTDSTRAYIANNKGEPVGVITFQDICKEMILQEARTKQSQFEKQQQEATAV